MNIEKYRHVSKSNRHTFRFISTGPKGSIEKVVTFLFNLTKKIKIINLITFKTLFMPAVKKHNGKKKADLIPGKHPRTPIDKNMPDYDQDPVFIKKHEDARAFLRKNGLPKEILQKINARKKK